MCNQVGPFDIGKMERAVLASWGIYRLQKLGSIWSRGEVDLEKNFEWGESPFRPDLTLKGAGV
ncbi:hypothetical protein [Acaryochloris marina]|uniref:hypothetical protein n=1 Tax=Acaryochloris marina TaxID=155978 RepID=UPI001BAE560B|nr:hypothetical protein [Acaryochloris marina]QUY45456.1 hypothetical protein I1H34_27150 [Acaryochloris marina S15]